MSEMRAQQLRRGFEQWLEPRNIPKGIEDALNNMGAQVLGAVQCLEKGVLNVSVRVPAQNPIDFMRLEFGRIDEEKP